jgi:hypothetical protein
LAESADYDPPRINSGIDFCRDELVDGGYRGQHAAFVFVGVKVETAEVKPASANPMVQVPSGELGESHGSGLCVPCWHYTAKVCSDRNGRTGPTEREIREPKKVP